MNIIVFKYSMPNFWITPVKSKFVTALAIVITNITAPPIPAAVLTFFETPRKGQIPRNWLKTTLLINAVVRRTRNKVLTII